MDTQNNLSTLTLGGGCFWCIESCFSMIRGVHNVLPGYSGGLTSDPTYEEVCTGNTGHAEVVQITYDPTVVSYEVLMEVFFFLHDPTQLNRQGNDIGSQYRSIIFYNNEIEKNKATKAIHKEKSKREDEQKIVTEVAPFEKFWKAEEYHQMFYKKNPTQPYCSMVVGPKVKKFIQYFRKKGILI